MNCPKCGASPPAGSRFCAACGSRLPVPCPQCGAQARPGDRFCTQCGSDLSPTAPEARAPLRGHVPHQLAQKILAARGKVAGEFALAVIEADEAGARTVPACSGG
jgi:uncharacterized membrane protein YvbJ